MIGDTKVPFTGKIALENISKFNIEETDGVRTFFLTLGLITGVVLLAYTVFAVSFINAISPN